MTQRPADRSGADDRNASWRVLTEIEGAVDGFSIQIPYVYTSSGLL